MLLSQDKGVIEVAAHPSAAAGAAHAHALPP